MTEAQEQAADKLTNAKLAIADVILCNMEDITEALAEKGFVDTAVEIKEAMARWNTASNEFLASITGRKYL